MVIAAGTGAALLAYAAIADLGINAGRGHYGVTVKDVEVGGMTFAEAEEVLRERGEKLRSTPICFTRDDFLACAHPADLGWFPGVRQTLDQAMDELRTVRAPRALDPPAPVDTSAVQELYDRHYLTWLDRPVPALGNRTPRAAARTKIWRPRLIDLLKRFENGS